MFFGYVLPAGLVPYCVLFLIVLVYKDKNTPSPFIEDLTKYGDDGAGKAGAKPDHIYMDCMGFGRYQSNYVLNCLYGIW